MSMLETLLKPERRQKAAEDQEALRQVMGHRVPRQPEQANYLYGVARERMALDQLEHLDLNEESEKVENLLNQLAEGRALQADFEGATELAPEGEHKEQYRAKAKAVANINQQQCGHPLLRLTGYANGKPNKPVGESTQLKSETAWNGKLTITFTRCLLCGSISAYA